MNYYILEGRREKVGRLQTLALLDRNALKALQAQYILQQINSRLISLYSLENKFSNLNRN
jgi:hypothetical protein